MVVILHKAGERKKRNTIDYLRALEKSPQQDFLWVPSL